MNTYRTAMDNGHYFDSSNSYSVIGKMGCKKIKFQPNDIEIKIKINSQKAFWVLKFPNWGCWQAMPKRMAMGLYLAYLNIIGVSWTCASIKCHIKLTLRQYF